MSSRTSTLFLCLLMSLSTLSCVTKTPSTETPPTPVFQPIPLGDKETHSLIFQKVFFRIESGSRLGEARMRGRVIDEMRWSKPSGSSLEFNVAISNGLRDLGYNVRDSADALFDSSTRAKVRYEMAAIIHQVELDFEYEYKRRTFSRGEGVGTARVQIEVLLHDTLQNKTVYSRTFVGVGEDIGLEPNPIVLAVVDGVMKSTADPDFVKLMRKEASDITESNDVVEIAACPDDVVTTLPEDLPEMLETVVEIRVGTGAGTGVIISPDGWILTAAHLVDGASEIWVRLRSGPQVPATIQRLDAHLDIALLRVAGRGYRCAQLREVDRDLDLGFDIFTINLALGDDRSHTISRGVVSGYMELDEQRYIQTDASVNPGSSGGPMLSKTGVVAGITVSKIAAEGFEGVAFAVPIQEAVRNMAIRLREN